MTMARPFVPVDPNSVDLREWVTVTKAAVLKYKAVKYIPEEEFVKFPQRKSSLDLHDQQNYPRRNQVIRKISTKSFVDQRKELLKKPMEISRAASQLRSSFSRINNEDKRNFDIPKLNLEPESTSGSQSKNYDSEEIQQYIKKQRWLRSKERREKEKQRRELDELKKKQLHELQEKSMRILNENVKKLRSNKTDEEGKAKSFNKNENIHIPKNELHIDLRHVKYNYNQEMEKYSTKQAAEKMRYSQIKSDTNKLARRESKSNCKEDMDIIQDKYRSDNIMNKDFNKSDDVYSKHAAHMEMEKTRLNQMKTDAKRVSRRESKTNYKEVTAHEKKAQDTYGNKDMEEWDDVMYLNHGVNMEELVAKLEKLERASTGLLLQRDTLPKRNKMPPIPKTSKFLA